jgi:predicted transcriptional regulator
MAMTLRLTDEETEALRRTAEREHRSMQEVARHAINHYTSERERRFTAALDYSVTEHAEVLERLRDM